MDVLALDYQIISCGDYIDFKKELNKKKTLVNRVDIDFSIKKAKRIGLIFNELGIRGTFFIRLHAPEYNPFSFENYKVVRFLIDSGHEIGYHSEIVDQAAVWNEDAAMCLRRDIEVINTMYNIKIRGVASHGGMTGLNNLDFWKDVNPKDFDLEYEAYDQQQAFDLFNNSLYVSDSEWTRWKCYLNGKLVADDERTIADHARDGHELIYSLIHSDTYFENHFYEDE